MAQASAVLYTVVQRTISGQLRMTRPDQAGSGNGLELWRLLVREYEVPGQPVAQRAFPRKWGAPQDVRQRHGAPRAAAPVVSLGA